MDIVFNPPANEENQYIQLLVSELRAKGYRIHPLATIFSSWKHFRSLQLIHLNWFENIDDHSFFKALRSFLRKLTVLTIIRLWGKPLVWTLHNRVTHEKGTALFSGILTRLLVRWSGGIVIHSRQSEAVLARFGTSVLDRVAYVPHPHFIGAYGHAAEAPPQADSTLRLLFIGMVKPYKNLELLIDVVGAFGAQVQLTIAGKAADENYGQRLAAEAENVGNVTLLPYFIPDGELARLLGETDAVVLPYDLASSLNSGTVILAFSYKKTVICPEIGTISDLGSHMEETFCYRYVSEEQHRTALAQQIQRAWALKQDDRKALHQKGVRLYQHVVAANDPREVGDTMARLYGYVCDSHDR